MILKGKTTKREYIEQSGHRNIIKRELMLNDWPDTQPIEIINGWDVVEPKSNMSRGSNLSRALDRSPSREYIKGGKISKRDGFSFAVKL